MAAVDSTTSIKLADCGGPFNLMGYTVVKFTVDAGAIATEIAGLGAGDTLTHPDAKLPARFTPVAILPPAGLTASLTYTAANGSTPGYWSVATSGTPTAPGVVEILVLGHY